MRGRPPSGISLRITPASLALRWYAMDDSCEIKVSLQFEWKEAKDTYERMVASLGHSQTNSSDREGMNRTIEIARGLVEQLEKDLEVHTRTHGC
jgi:hypothetical protein